MRIMMMMAQVGALLEDGSAPLIRKILREMMVVVGIVSGWIHCTNNTAATAAAAAEGRENGRNTG
jgi:hypothetical protein